MHVHEVRRNGQIVERETFNLASGRYLREVDSGAGLAVVVDRALSATETQSLQEKQNAEAIEARLRDALAANQTFLALATPSNAQVVAHVRQLTRQVSALIRRQAADFREVET